MTGRAAPPTGRWQARLAIARRDLLEFVRDRRAVFITLVMPMAMYPLLALSSTLGIRAAVTDLDRKAASSRLDLLFSGPDARPFAERIGRIAGRTGRHPDGWPARIAARIVAAADAPPLLDEGAAQAWIDVPAGTVAGLDAEGTVPLEVRLSARRPPDRHVKPLILGVIRGLADEARLARVGRAGLPPSVLEPLRIDFVGDLPTTPMSAIRDILPTAVAAVLVLLALLTATGGFYPAIDAIAGEKERGTIETLLIAPCAAFDVVAGKFLAVFAVTLATLLANAISISLTAMVLARILPAAAVGRLPVGETVSCVTLTVIAYVGLAAVAAGLCLAVTAASKSAKEAQNTLTPVVVLIAALAGSALLPGAESRRWLPAVPFAGQVTVAKSLLTVFEPRTAAVADDGQPSPRPTSIAVDLTISLVSSAVLTWLLLLLTAALVSNEEILFRGPDTAARGLNRPPPRTVPTPWQGFAAALAGFTALWYAQAFAADDLVPALVTQQAVAVLAPLVLVSWWQRVDGRATFAVRWPGSAPATLAAAAGAALVGGGMFVVGAAAALALWGGDVSADARLLAERLVDLVRGSPTWLAVLLLAVMPAVCEELLFRGWLLAAFAGGRPTPRRAAVAVVAQATLFAAFHLLPERMPQTFAVGLALGWMTLATGSLLPALVAHAVHNATPVILVAAATPADLAAVEAGTSTGLPPWAVAAAIGCVAGGGLLLAVIRCGRTSPEVSR